MAGTGPGDLFLTAQELLEAATEALDSIPTYEPELNGAPERTYVSPGEPALDCCDPGQLSVHVTQAQHIAPLGGLPAQAQKDRLNGPAFMITVARCIPSSEDSGEPPSVEDMEAAAEQINADGWALWNHIFNLWASGQLFTLCGVVSLDLQPLAPSGGCSGWRLTVRTNLDGYQETLSS